MDTTQEVVRISCLCYDYAATYYRQVLSHFDMQGIIVSLSDQIEKVANDPKQNFAPLNEALHVALHSALRKANICLERPVVPPSLQGNKR